ncbi:MAG: class I SAM-dependent methyltransferase, partial [Thermoplasmata archaeon]
MEYYDVIASGYDELYSQEQLKKYNLINEYLDMEENETLLDVGCGIGLSSGPFNCRIIGIDPAKEMLRRTRMKATERTDYIQARAEYLPFKDTAFDAVICVTAVHNFQEPKKGIKEMKRVGKGKGAIT